MVFVPLWGAIDRLQGVELREISVSEEDNVPLTADMITLPARLLDLRRRPNLKPVTGVVPRLTSIHFPLCAPDCRAAPFSTSVRVVL